MCDKQGNQRQAVLYAYIAGILDGEGSFVIIKSTRPVKSKMMKSPVYSGGLSLGMVDKEVVDLVSEVIGSGKVYEERVPERRSIWRVRAVGRKAILPFLYKIKDYLMVKKEHCYHLINFLECWETPYVRMLGVSKQELQRREDAYQMMRKLNAVGAAATTKPLSTGDGEVIV